MDDDSRFPRSVYGTGDEPDPRFSLANERTFLAWIRTALAFIAAGVAIEALQLDITIGLRIAGSILLIFLGLASAVHAWRSWARTERAMRQRRALPAPSLSIWIVVGTFLAVVLISLGLYL